MLNIFADMSTGAAVVSAFMSGVAVIVFGYAGVMGIANAISEYLKKPAGTMAVRNK